MSTDQEMVLAHFIVSDDVERSRLFYTEVLGGKAVISGEANDAVLRDAAQRVGLDWDALLRARDSDEVKGEMARIASLAQRLGVQGTPASYLSSGEVIGGAAASDRFLAAWAQKK